jgi:hypothetical protein
VEVIQAGPDVKRFAELKVGDKVRARYYESVVFVLRRPGEKSTAPSDTTKLTPTSPQAGPGGTVARQITATVTVEAVDAKLGSMTVRTADGLQLIRKVDDPKRLAGVKAGDRIDITYTQALVLTVEPVK